VGGKRLHKLTIKEHQTPKNPRAGAIPLGDFGGSYPLLTANSGGKTGPLRVRAHMGGKETIKDRGVYRTPCVVKTECDIENHGYLYSTLVLHLKALCGVDARRGGDQRI